MRATRALAFALLLLMGAIASADDKPGTYAGKDAAWWIQQLEDPAAAPAARAALKKIGQAAVKPLGKALSSKSRAIRYGAARTLRDMRADLAPVLSQLIKAVKGSDATLRALTLPLLHRVGEALLPHLDVIVPLVQSSKRDIAGTALGLLQMLGREARAALPQVLAVVRDGPARMRVRALTAAIALAPDAEEIVAVASDLFARSDDRTRAQIIGALRKLRPEVAGLDALAARAAKDLAPAVRNQAATLLGAVGLEVPGRVADLVALLGDPDHGVRNRTAYALQRLGSHAAQAVPALESVLEDPDATAHVAAIRALSAIGAPALRSFDHVVRAATKANPSRDLLGATTAYVAADVDLTLKALAHDAEHIKEIGLRVVSGWTPERWAGSLSRALGPVKETLLARAKPPYSDTRILETLGRLSRDHPEVLETLLALSKAESKTIRSQVARLIGAHPSNGDLLIELLTGSDPVERAFAEEALTLCFRMSGQALNARLLALLHHEDNDVRERAGRLVVLGFGYIDPRTLEPADAKALAAACARLITHPKQGGSAISRLGMLGAHALPYVDDLVALLPKDGWKSGGRSAAWALAGIARSGDEARARIEPVLLDRIQGDDPVAAARSAVALAALATRDDVLLARLPALMRHAKDTVYHTAVEAAQHLGPRGITLVPVLVELVVSPTEGTRVHMPAVSALPRIAPDDPRSVRAFIAGLSDPKRKDMASAYLGALRSGGDNTIHMVAEALAGAKPETQVHLLGVLAGFRLRASSVRGNVQPLTESPDLRVARAAKQALAALSS